MEVKIRRETEKDYIVSEMVVEKAFKNAEHSDNKEHILVSKLRKSDMFLPELSLVAEYDNQIVGHIMLTNLIIENGLNKYLSLALAPVSVLPEYQNKGIGGKLIKESLRISKEHGYKSVIVLGHSKYYPRFGFKPASVYGIKAPFDVPDEVFMALGLDNNSLKGISGTVQYGKEFFE